MLQLVNKTVGIVADCVLQLVNKTVGIVATVCYSWLTRLWV